MYYYWRGKLSEKQILSWERQTILRMVMSKSRRFQFIEMDQLWSKEILKLEII
jgi:hypothetical protein